MSKEKRRIVPTQNQSPALERNSKRAHIRSQNVLPPLKTMVDESQGNCLISSSHGNHENPSIKANHHNNNNNKNIDNTTTTNRNNNNSSKEQDRFLPIANVGRIMKKAIPGNGKISKDAKETVQECVSEFISFITGEASEKCQQEKRKTINGDDIIWSISTLGFEDYVTPLKMYLSKYRETEVEKPAIPKQQQQRSCSDQSPSQQQQLQLMQQLQDHHHHHLRHLDHHLHQQLIDQKPFNDHHHQLIDQNPMVDHHNHLIGPKSMIDQDSLIDQKTLIGGTNSGGLTPFPNLSNVYSPHTATGINPHHQQPPPPPPSFVGADQALITLPNFLPSNKIQKTYHQHPEQIDSVGHW